jgi:predicted GNAT family acetyltransferase
MIRVRRHNLLFGICSRSVRDPTSNGIYQRIGYEAVTDVDRCTFV